MRFFCNKCDGIFFSPEKPKSKHLRKVVVNGINTEIMCNGELIEFIECRMCGNDNTTVYINPDTKLCNACQSIEDQYEKEEFKNRNVEQLEF